MSKILFTLGLAGALALGQSALAAPGGHAGGGGHSGGGGGHSGGGGGHSGGAYHGGYGGGSINHGGYGGSYNHGGYGGGSINHGGYGGIYNHGGYGGYGGSFYSPLNSGRYGGYGYGGYGYGGLGIGLGFGLPFGSSYYNYYYSNPGYAPYSSRYYGSGLYFSPYSTMVTTPLNVPQGGIPNGLNNSAPASQVAESGLKITDIFDGSAKKADLRAGDVILGIGKMRTRTFDELQAALAQSKGDVDLIFLNSENGKVEKLPLAPLDGKIGVAVVPVDLNGN